MLVLEIVLLKSFNTFHQHTKSLNWPGMREISMSTNLIYNLNEFTLSKSHPKISSKPFSASGSLANLLDQPNLNLNSVCLYIVGSTITRSTENYVYHLLYHSIYHSLSTLNLISLVAW